MSHTYKAVLRGDRLEWIGEAPEYQRNRPVDVRVTVLKESKAASHGPKMAEILEKIAEGGGFSRGVNPVSWQRKLRRDRSLPGRDNGCS